ncbi:MAG: sulfite exporter TauE/SafE family protein [Brevefilum sp.]
MTKKIYYINGMHCSGCETFIERSLREIKGVEDAKVSLAGSQVEIQAKSQRALPTLEELNQRFNKHGYSFTEQPHKKTLQPKNLAAVIGIFALIILLFFLAERSTLLNFLYVDSDSNFVAYLLFGIAAGFSSCAALVGSLLLSVQESWANRQPSHKKGSFYPFFLFNSARVVSFAVLGGMLGLLGGVFQFSLQATAVLTILIAALIFIIGMQMLGVPFFQKIPLNMSGQWVSRVTNKPSLQEKFMPILMGAITFFVPCGFTLIAQAGALRSGNFIDGLTILLAFALGTLPVLLFISFSSAKLHQNPRFARSFRVLSGLLIVFFAAYTMISQITMLNPSSLGREDAPSLSAPAELMSEDTPYQLMQMEARGFEYHPEVITIKAHLPTRFEIDSNGSLGCANAVYARGLYPDVIILSPGLNVVEFTAPAPGTYQISCSMWMVKPITVVVE